jgi:hypothetical protein
MINRLACYLLLQETENLTEGDRVMRIHVIVSHLYIDARVANTYAQSGSWLFRSFQ